MDIFTSREQSPFWSDRVSQVFRLFEKCPPHDIESASVMLENETVNYSVPVKRKVAAHTGDGLVSVRPFSQKRLFFGRKPHSLV